MPFWKRNKTELEPESLRLPSDQTKAKAGFDLGVATLAESLRLRPDQVEATAAEAVERFLNMIRAEGYDLAGIQELEGRRAFEPFGRPE